MNNIKKAVGGAIDIHFSQATIYIDPLEQSADRIAKVCADVFGVSALCVAERCEKDIAAIRVCASEMLRGRASIASFKVESKRADKKFPLKSPEISMEVGGYIHETNGIAVDVVNPACIVYVDIREQHAYVYTSSDRITGRGGIPVGTGGNALAMLSGGIDSPVSCYCMAKRGVTLAAIHFFSYPYTSMRAKDKVAELARILTRFCGDMKLYVVPFTDIQIFIRDNYKEQFGTLLMRRAMVKIANAVAEKEGHLALISGESLGQVASQTLEAIVATDNASTMPILRPLIGMNKEEIIAIARDIGTFETSILPYEDCCTVFTPKHPTTRPKLSSILHEESKHDYSNLLQQAIENIEIIEIDA